MVKFAQQLQAELVPEWQEAYCSYGELKADLKRIQKHRAMGPTYTRTGSLGLLKSLASMKPSISGIGRTLSRRRVADHISFSPKGTTEDSIVVCLCAEFSLSLVLQKIWFITHTWVVLRLSTMPLLWNSITRHPALLPKAL